MSDAAISTAQPSDLIAVLTDARWEVIIGAAQPDGDGTAPGAATGGRFLACWPITPARTGEALAQEDAGQIQDVWQINCFAPDVAMALALRNAVTNLVWPVGWELVDVGPCIPDSAPAPLGWFVPLDYKFTTVGN